MQNHSVNRVEGHEHTHCRPDGNSSPEGVTCPPASRAERIKLIFPEPHLEGDIHLSDHPSVPLTLLMGGQVYTVSLSRRDGSLEAEVARRAQAYAQQAQTFLASLRRDYERRLEELWREQCDMAQGLGWVIPESLWQAGAAVFLSHHQLCYLLPFRYHPQFIMSGQTRSRITDPAFAQPRLWSLQLLLNPREMRLTSVKLGKRGRGGRWTRVSHYHGSRSYDCFGTWQYPCDWDGTVQWLLNFRDQYERMLETINADSLLNSHPRGLPLFDNIQREWMTEEQPSGWDTRRVAPPPLPVNEPEEENDERDGSEPEDDDHDESAAEEAPTTEPVPALTPPNVWEVNQT